MIDLREPRFPWGLRVAAAVDLHNDGSHPGVAEGALLVCTGGLGEIVRIGHQVDENLPIYLVDFSGVLVGCLEEEIIPADALETAADEVNRS